MEVTNISPNTSPCWLFRTESIVILADCCLDFSSLINGRHSHKPCPPRLLVPPVNSYVDLYEIDVIIVSNYHSFAGLPWISKSWTEKDWGGIIYCTLPTFEFAKIYLKEIGIYMEEVENDLRSNELTGEPTGSMPGEKMVEQEQIEACLSFVKAINYGEVIDLYGIASVTAHSSGFCIGACNWVIEIYDKKISYVCDHTSLKTHASRVDTKALKDSDLLILNGLKSCPGYSPDRSVNEACQTLEETVKRGGSVMFPVFPTGVMLDLLEIFIDYLSQMGRGHIPFYFISPIAKAALAHAQIYPEALSEGKQEKAALPQFPFDHDIAIEKGRLKILEDTNEGLSESFRSPAVFFGGHPCLELGLSRKLGKDWSNNPRNRFISTEAGFPIHAFAGRMNVKHVPVDTRMTTSSAKIMIQELKPKELIICQAILHVHPKLRESLIPPRIFHPGKTHDFNSFKTFREVKMDVSAASRFGLRPAPSNPEILVGPISGTLNISNGQFRFTTDYEGTSNIEQKLWGSMTVEGLARQLKLDGFKNVEIQGRKILIGGPDGRVSGFIQLGTQSTHIHHDSPVFRRRILHSCRKTLAP